MKFLKALLILSIPFLMLGVVSSCDSEPKEAVSTEYSVAQDNDATLFQHAIADQDAQYELTQNPIDEDEVNEGIDSTAEKILVYIGAILAVLEIILRLIPTYSDNTVVGNIVKVLHIISDRLNRLKKK